MNETLQTIIALAVVVLAVAWLGWRAFAQGGAPGCGSSGCAGTTNRRKPVIKTPGHLRKPVL